MAYTQADLDAIDAAIKTGARVVQFSDRRTEFRSLEEMRQIRQVIFESVTEADSGKRRPRAFRLSVDRGL